MLSAHCTLSDNARRDQGSWGVPTGGGGKVWAPWAAHTDPVHSIEVDVVWEGLVVGSGQHQCQHQQGSSVSAGSKRSQGSEQAAAAGISGGDGGAGGEGWSSFLAPSLAQHWVVHALGPGGGLCEPPR